MGHDAFGREDSEDPITAMGWERPAGTLPARREAASPPKAVVSTTRHEPSVRSAFSQETVPSVGAEQSAFSQGASSPGSAQVGNSTARSAGSPDLSSLLGQARVLSRSRRAAETATGRPGNGFRWIRRFVVLAVVAAIGVPLAGGAVEGIRESIEESSSEPSVTREPPPSGPDGDEPARPFTTRAGLAPVLERMQELAPGRPIFVSVTDEQVNVSVSTANGRVAIVGARQGEPTRILTTSASDAGARSFDWGRVDPAAPSRLRRQLGPYDAATLILAGTLRWVVSVQGGETMYADPDGRNASPNPP